jgi:hypothetical protein
MANKKGKNRKSRNNGSVAWKLKNIRKRKVFHQPHPPLHPMSLSDEDAAIDLCFLLFCVLTLHLGPSLWNYMTRRIWNDPIPIAVDAYEFLKTIIDLRRTNASLFTTNSPTDMINLETAQEGRLAVAHGYFDEVSRNWSAYLLSWVEVLKMIDAHTAAASVQAIHDELISGNKKPLDVVIFSFTRPDFMNRGMSLQTETELSRAQYVKAIRIQMALYRSMVKNFGPALRDENHIRTGKARADSEMDVQNLLFDLLEIWLQKPQQDPDTAANVRILETAKDGRNMICHSNLPLLLTDWEGVLLSWQQVATLISNVETAKAIRDYRMKLKTEIDLPSIPIPGQGIRRSTLQPKYFINLVRMKRVPLKTRVAGRQTSSQG